MADLIVGAVGRVESVSATDQDLKLCFEVGELTPPRLDVAQPDREQGADVGAGCGTFIA